MNPAGLRRLGLGGTGYSLVDRAARTMAERPANLRPPVPHPSLDGPLIPQHPVRVQLSNIAQRLRAAGPGHFPAGAAGATEAQGPNIKHELIRKVVMDAVLKMLAGRTPGPQTGPRATTSTPPAQPEPPATDDALTRPPTHVPDATVPEAVSYSNMMLHRLAEAGYTPEMFGIQGDPTAMWRALSPISGALAAIRSGHADQYQIPANVDPGVRQVIEHLLYAATHADTEPAHSGAGAGIYGG